MNCNGRSQSQPRAGERSPRKSGLLGPSAALQGPPGRLRSACPEPGRGRSDLSTSPRAWLRDENYVNPGARSLPSRVSGFGGRHSRPKPRTPTPPARSSGIGTAPRLGLHGLLRSHEESARPGAAPAPLNPAAACDALALIPTSASPESTWILRRQRAPAAPTPARSPGDGGERRGQPGPGPSGRPRARERAEHPGPSSGTAGALRGRAPTSSLSAPAVPRQPFPRPRPRGTPSPALVPGPARRPHPTPAYPGLSAGAPQACAALASPSARCPTRAPSGPPAPHTRVTATLKGAAPSGRAALTPKESGGFKRRG
ncbi:uncharacterized protein [Macaca fascicularis]|uniref:uncharacterized protein n=1 Tax=Macaca fascicularis TaxID=9541 RepID=UPI0032B02EB4